MDRFLGACGPRVACGSSVSFGDVLFDVESRSVGAQVVSNPGVSNLEPL